MVEDLITDAVSLMFDGVPCVEYAGQEMNGGTVYLTYNDIEISYANQKKLISAFVTLAVAGVSGRVGIGYLSDALNNYKSKPDSVKIEADDKKEVRRWISEAKFYMEKSARVVIETDYNIIREEIKGINLQGAN